MDGFNGQIEQLWTASVDNLSFRTATPESNDILHSPSFGGMVAKSFRSVYKLPSDGISAMSTAPLIGGTLRYAALVANFGPLVIGFTAARARARGLPKAERDKVILQFCEENRDAPLKACLAMGGFYIKIGQVLSGMPALPRPWMESLRTLQRDVPARPVDEIVDLIESDFGCSLEEVGLRNFSVQPLGAASIGQAHKATLNGKDVVVKVMYPEGERFFRLDFQQILNLVGGVNQELVEPLERMQELFESEFDYRREASNLRRMCDCVAPHFATGDPPVRFPQPYDARHPLLPKLPPGSRVAEAGALVTKHVLVMDRCVGLTITEVADDLLERLAASKGMTADAHREAMRVQAMTAVKKLVAGDTCGRLAFGCLAAAAEPAQRVQLSCAIAAHAAQNAPRRAINAMAYCTSLPEGLRIPLVPRPIALQVGPGLIDRLFEVHAHQIFVEGVFNADPHPGNCMIDSATGVITLIDYGQLTEISHKERIAYAYYLLAGETGDAELSQAAYVGLGFDVTWKGLYTKLGSDQPVVRVDDPALRIACHPPPAWVTLNAVHVDFGSPSEALAVLQSYGIDPFSGEEVNPLKIIKEMFEVRRLPGTYGMLQRMCLCLKAVATSVGMGDCSATRELAPHARRWLRSCNMNLRDLDAASAGRDWRTKYVSIQP